MIWLNWAWVLILPWHIYWGWRGYRNSKAAQLEYEKVIRMLSARTQTEALLRALADVLFFEQEHQCGPQQSENVAQILRTLQIQDGLYLHALQDHASHFVH